ncbi:MULTISPECIES: high frequency lysogenization protein HflD [Pseudoalteromonas]|jgi:high frequency lysogenization protein|uniref:High frequency lysogenization protein HflD homolog n=2 Tax=Pseudoalteromonas lipolytica TaxID=570156 RepID=A0AAD0WC59_9GAMM|nr:MULTISPECIES: high frequency lysogenization protein HflD [Pseudoalteromonas]AXV65108.1 lysogenization regulator HflD [Pseudoalteromonas donghaensis]EWH07262.1 lysogenization regulator [Pseudoalteromonas lipolytica SCSIO 04301]MBE0351058.1 high frequency lysogenization protein [Pseudoalteromonas lipolytica LMEB 39]MCC9659881.1 high frequency lysogenization protein HflD [Pseudoalteromonas sp. MB41]QLJ09613.1 high frequency lysogenization protein HflD [Pseudoalteromonas sp. JSTW]|tara:strand:- start:229 stop:831 length:603 start_codon:yes stop_codon:yes gene_type:complete
MTEHQVMALAAMCQVAKQVQKVAQYGSGSDHELEKLLNCIVETSPNTPEDVYQGKHNLREGYRVLTAQLSAGADKDVEIVKYVGGLMQLERALSAKQNSLNELGRRIDDVKRRLDHFAITDDTVVAALADIYSSVLSPLGHRIQVYGKPELLKQQLTQNKIRALLLAGIRSAVLWRQMGGKRRHFFFAKRKILAIAKQYI